MRQNRRDERQRPGERVRELERMADAKASARLKYNSTTSNNGRPCNELGRIHHQSRQFRCRCPQPTRGKWFRRRGTRKL